MANFTDNVPALSKFNPYISQAPIIEEMGIVGREKQAKYDAGVEKIQGQIDQVAGMDLVKDVHKEYLQKSLNQLGKNLKFVAAGDFSNYQLVNSVGGMVNTIGKDKYIQGAVASTNAYRKDVANMEQAKKDGKSSPSNEYVFGLAANKWLTDGDVKTSYNSSYKPYTNWKKNGLDVIKALTKSENIADDAFDGVDKNGNPIISDTTIRRKLAGIPPEQIQQALMSALTPADFEQMQTDGIYSYANVGGQEFFNHVYSARNNSLKHYQDQKKELEDAKSGTTSVAEVAKLDAKIASLNTAMADVAKGYDEIGKLTSTNLDAAKAQFYTRNAIDGFSKAFSFTETSQTYVGKTPREMEMWREENRYKATKDLADFQQRERFHNDEMAIKRFDSAVKAKEAGLDGSGNSAAAGGGVAKPIPKEEVPQYSMGIIANKRTVLENDVIASKVKFLDTYKDKDGNTHDETWYNAQYKNWQERPSAIDGVLAAHFAEQANKERDLAAIDATVVDLSNEAEKRFGNLDSLIPQEEGPTVWDEEAKTYINYTPKEIVDYNNKVRKKTFIKYESDNRGKLSIKYDDEVAAKELTPKEYKMYESFKNNKTSSDKVLVESMQDLNREVNVPYGKVLEDKDAFMNDELTARMTNNQAVGYGVQTVKPADRNKIQTFMSNMTQVAEGQKGKLAGSPDFDVEKAKKILGDNNSVYTIDVREGTTADPQTEYYKIYAVSPDGTSVSFKMTPEEKRGEFGTDYEAAPEVLAIRKYQDHIRFNGGTTTNLKKAETSHTTAYLNKNEFPNVSRYGINGDLKQIGKGREARYDLSVNVYDPITKRWYDNVKILGDKLIPEGDILKAFMTLDDSSIHQMLTESESTTTQDLKNLEKAAKEPF